MNRKVRSIERKFKVFCEGKTEYNYFNGMRKNEKSSLKIKFENIKGGGYRNILSSIQKDSDKNCIAKFIVIDRDLAQKNTKEKEELYKLLEYCKIQNESDKTPYIVVLNQPNFEYIACAQSEDFNNQETKQFIKKYFSYKNISEFKADGDIYLKLNRGKNSKDILINYMKNKPIVVKNNIKYIKRNYDFRVKTEIIYDNIGKKGSNIEDYFSAVAEVG